MTNTPAIHDIKIRTDLHAGDLGYVIHRHGSLYQQEYNYGISFEMYVAAGLADFYDRYDEQTECIWICEHGDTIVGFLLLMNRQNAIAQLRYFYLEPAYRGIGLGKLLMEKFIEFLKEKKYKSAFLWTTDELSQAAKLYRRFGFELTEEKPSTAFGKPVIEQRYDLHVPADQL